MVVKDDPFTSPRSFPLSSRSTTIRMQPSNRSFSEYRRTRMARSLTLPKRSRITQEDTFVMGDFENSFDEVIQEEENSTSIEKRFKLTEGYVGEGVPTLESTPRSVSPSRSVSKMFENKISDLNKEIGRLEAENWTLRNERQGNVKIVAEQREQIDILLSRQECLTKDLNRTMIELEDQKKITQTIKEDRDALRQQLDVHLQKELTQYKQSEYAFYCKTCDTKLFARSLIVSEVRSLNEGTSYIVKSLQCEFTLGPQAVRNFPSLSKLFRVRSLYCDGCLKQIGYKFSSVDQIKSVDSQSKHGDSRYWIEGQYINSREQMNRKHKRTVTDLVAVRT